VFEQRHIFFDVFYQRPPFVSVQDQILPRDIYGEEGRGTEVISHSQSMLE
jgi:hypothetical protein